MGKNDKKNNHLYPLLHISKWENKGGKAYSKAGGGIIRKINDRDFAKKLYYSIGENNSELEDRLADFESYIGEIIKRIDGAEGEVLVSTVLFDNYSEVLHDRVPIEQIEPMTREDYTVRGCTALLDATGGAIHHIGNVHKYARAEDVPEHTVFVITTDGMENASRQYGSQRVKEMIRRQTEKYGWEIIFVAANIDAVETAESIGIRRERAANYRQTSEGYAACYDAMSAFVTMARSSAAPVDEREWKRHLEKGN